MGIMFRKFITYITSRRDNQQLMLLAKLEFGRDWEWAYNELLNDRKPTAGVKL